MKLQFLSHYSQCGLLSIDAFPLKAAKQVKRNLDEIGLTSSLIHEAEFKERYPMLRYDQGTGAVLEKEAGVLMASKCLKAYQVVYEFIFNCIDGSYQMPIDFFW